MSQAMVLERWTMKRRNRLNGIADRPHAHEGKDKMEVTRSYRAHRDREPFRLEHQGQGRLGDGRTLLRRVVT